METALIVLQGEVVIAFLWKLWPDDFYPSGQKTLSFVM